MPNTFAPRAYSEVVKDRTKRLRREYDGPKIDVKEWHGMVDVMDEESTEEFLEKYNRVETIPYVVSGVGRERGHTPGSDGDK